MITPGLFRHYKGNVYRVLFVATWAGGSPPNADDALEVGLVDGTWLAVTKALPDAKWSGNSSDVLAEEPVVIYVALYGDGRISARTEKEFEERVAKEDSEMVSRFTRIGD